MKKAFNSILGILLAITLLPFTVFAGEKPQDTSGEEKITVIVKVKGDAVLEAQNAKALGYKKYLATNEAKTREAKLRALQSEACSEIKSSISEDTPVLFTYTHIFNGFAIEISKKDIEKIKALPNVEDVYIDREYTAFESEGEGEALPEETSQDEPYLMYGGEMMKLEYMHDMGITGKGLVIAVIDVSFDVNHIMFSEPVAEPRLSKNDIADIIKNNSLSICDSNTTISANRVYRNSKIPYAFNYYSRNADTYCERSSHGVHVAGIAAGNHGIDILGNRIVGAAPDAQLLLMSCGNGTGDGSLSNAAIVAGMEDAVKLGADVINCSFGSAYSCAETVEIEAINTARNAGVMVSVAAGNESRGEKTDISADLIDYSTHGSPNEISTATSVASIESISKLVSFSTFVVDGNEIRYKSKNDEVSFYDALKDTEPEYVYAGKGLENDFEHLDIEGKIALVDTGDVQWRYKALNAQAHGAIGVIVIYDSLLTQMAQSPLLHIPVATVHEEDEDKLKNAVEKKITLLEGSKTGIITGKKLRMSSFSSWDTGSLLEMKPEITAPGGEIYSSLNDDTFGVMSGTSMATPFFSGATALLMEYIAENPGKYEAQGNRTTLAENLFMSTADVIMQDTEHNIPYSPRLQGAGLANIEKAAKTPVILLGDELTADEFTYRKAKVSLRTIELDDNDTFSIPFTARNLTDEPVTYDNLSVKVMTDDADENGYIRDMRELTFVAELPESVTVPANGETELNIAVTLDKDELDRNMEVFTNGFFIDGYVFLDNDDENIPKLNIPFTGFYGDWGAQPALDGYIYDDNMLSGTFLCTYTKRKANGGEASAKEEHILGYNLFNEDNADLRGKEYVGISPNYDGEADSLNARFVPIRMTGKTDFAICDTDGNEIIRKTDISGGDYYYTPKYDISYLTFQQSVLTTMPDGDYVFKIYAGYRYDEPYQQDEVIEMPFYIDREAPKINEFSVSEDGRELSLSISDNRHIMGFIVAGVTRSGVVSHVYPVAAQKDYSTVIDISGFAKDSVAVEVLDYAYNSASASNYPPTFEYSGRKGTEFSFTAYNISGHDIPCTMIMGLYLNNSLVGMTYKDEVISAGTSHKILNLDCGAYDTIKIFAWNSLESMEPLSN